MKSQRKIYGSDADFCTNLYKNMANYVLIKINEVHANRILTSEAKKRIYVDSEKLRN